MSCGCPPTCEPVCFTQPPNFGLDFPSLVGPQGPPGGPGTIVNSLAELRLLDTTTFTQGYTAMVTGYAAAGDGGGGLFTLDITSALTDNDGTIVDPSAGPGRWLRIFAGQINAKWFGAKGDGVTDDTAAIQRAIDAVPISSGGTTGQGGYTVYLPPGKYITSAALVIGFRRMAIMGNGLHGSNGTMLKCTDSNVTIIDAFTGSGDTFSLYGVQFFGNGKGTGTGNGIRLGRVGQTLFDSQIHNCWFTAIPNACIYADYTADLMIQNCGIENAVYGVYIVNAGIAGGDINKITGNTFYGLTYGAFVAGGENLLITGNQFNFCGTTPGGVGDNTTGAIVLNHAGAAGVRATLIGANSFRANTNDIIINGNGGSSAANTGVNDTLISGNFSDRPYRRFIGATDANNVRVIGNAINAPSQETDNTYPAIDILGTSDSAFIDDNTVTNQNVAIRANFGLRTATTTTNTTIGTNNFAGAVASYSIGAAATFGISSNMSGTWTPALVGSTTAGVNTYTTQAGKWTRIGDLIWATCNVVLSAKDGTIAGDISIRGLPFTLLAGDAPVSVTVGAFGTIALAANEHLTARTSGLVGNALDLISSNSGGASSAVQAADIAATSEINLTVVYRCSAAAIQAGTTVL